MTIYQPCRNGIQYITGPAKQSVPLFLINSYSSYILVCSCGNKIMFILKERGNYLALHIKYVFNIVANRPIRSCPKNVKFRKEISTKNIKSA